MWSESSGSTGNPTPEAVRALMREQFPAWAELQISPVVPGGWDNRTFRLGTDKLVRLPSGPAYVPQVAKEQRWLPYLASKLTTRLPEPLAHGQPSKRFPWPWSVYRWIEGDVAAFATVADPRALGRDAGRFLRELRTVDASRGPVAGAHNFHRGGSLSVYADEVTAALEKLEDPPRLPVEDLWRTAVASEWTDRPVWVHGDFKATNLLVRDGRLHAVIDFGCSGVGDPACDLTIAWTFFRGAARVDFLEAADLDRATWERARGWALWKALITLAAGGTHEWSTDESRAVIEAVCEEHLQRG